MTTLLLLLQIFHVLFLALHDWVPLGKLNDVKAVRAANPGEKLLVATLVSTIPFAFGLAASFFYAGKGFPSWLYIYLWVSYTFLFVGELERVVDSILLWRETRARIALPSHVWRHAQFSARAPWHSTQHAARYPAFGNGGLVGGSRRAYALNAISSSDISSCAACPRRSIRSRTRSACPASPGVLPRRSTPHTHVCSLG